MRREAMGCGCFASYFSRKPPRFARTTSNQITAISAQILANFFAVPQSNCWC